MHIEDQMLYWDAFLASPRVNSSISIALRGWAHTNVTSKTIMYPNPNPNHKNLIFGPPSTNSSTILQDSPKGIIYAGFSIRIRNS